MLLNECVVHVYIVHPATHTLPHPRIHTQTRMNTAKPGNGAFANPFLLFLFVSLLLDFTYFHLIWPIHLYPCAPDLHTNRLNEENRLTRVWNTHKYIDTDISCTALSYGKPLKVLQLLHVCTKSHSSFCCNDSTSSYPLCFICFVFCFFYSISIDQCNAVDAAAAVAFASYTNEMEHHHYNII